MWILTAVKFYTGDHMIISTNSTSSIQYTGVRNNQPLFHAYQPLLFFSLATTSLLGNKFLFVWQPVLISCLHPLQFRNNSTFFKANNGPLAVALVTWLVSMVTLTVTIDNCPSIGFKQFQQQYVVPSYVLSFEMYCCISQRYNTILCCCS